MGIQETKLIGALASRARLGAAVLCAAFVALGNLHAQVPEPETVFFGRIINRTSGQEYQLHEGTISWTVSGGGSAPVTITAPLGSFQDGKYSYVLKVPHQAKSLDLNVDGGKLPLRPSEVDFEGGSIQVNGAPAVPVSGSLVFTASQPNRGKVHRIDLEVFDTLEDTDGDGIPDWWEDLYGLDKQWAGDASLRHGDNRYTYLEAFRLGLDPRLNDRLPQLMTSEVVVMKEGSTGLLLRTVASNTAPAQIVYRLSASPVGGSVVLRNARPDPKNAHRTLRTGETFTQADVDAGLVEFVHSDATVTASALSLVISATNMDAAPLPAEVAVIVFQPEPSEGRTGVRWASDSTTGPAPEKGSAFDLWKRRATSAFAEEWPAAARQKDEIAAFLLSRWFDYTIWRGQAELPSRNLTVPSAGLSTTSYAASFISRYGRARNHLLIAGDGSVQIDGGMNSDILIAGAGNTTMRGNGGADVFVAARGRMVVEDFKEKEGDVLDLSSLLNGVPGALTDRVEITANAGNTQLRIPLGGSEAALVTLRGIRLAQKDLERWRKAGSLFTGDLSGVATPKNRAPVALPDEGYVVAEQPVSIAVLSNDSDPDGDALTIESVSPGTAGSTEIEDSRIVYRPGPGFMGRDQFSYTISDGRGGLATGRVTITYPYPAAAGTYQPLVLDDDGSPVGRMNLQLKASGQFTLKLNLRGAVYNGKGQFGAGGVVELTLRNGSKSVTIKLNINLADSSYPLTAEIHGGEIVDQVPASVAVGSSKTLLPKALKFTVALNPPDGVSAGYGFATMTVARNSAVRIAGQMPDGTPFSSATIQRRDSSVTWTTNLYKGGGWLLSSWLLRDVPDAPIEGTTRWVCTAMEQAVESGWNRVLSIRGSHYSAPAASAVSVFDFTDPSARFVSLSVSEGGLAVESESIVELAAADVVRTGKGGSLTLKINRKNGLWSGTVGIDGVNRPIRGVILQNQNQGFGYFLNGTLSGPAKLFPQ